MDSRRAHGRSWEYAWGGGFWGVGNEGAVGAFEGTEGWLGEVGGFGVVGAQEALRRSSPLLRLFLKVDSASRTIHGGENP